MYYFYLPALLSLAAALSPTLQTPQFSYPQQQQDSRNLWDRIDTDELNKQLAAWHNEPIISSTKNPVVAGEARQSYPEIPRPIPPIQGLPTQPEPIQSPQGCLAPRGQFPSPRSCAHYLNCWDDVVIEQQCPGGLLFNELTSVCDFEYNVYCAGRPGLPPKPELPPGAKICPEPNGRYRSSTNCSEFFVCVYGKPVKYGCPRGLVYNEDLGVCDYPFRVDCRGAAVPDPWTPSPRPPHPTKPRPPQPPKEPQYPPQQPQQPQYPPQYPSQQPQYPPQQPQYPPQQPQYPPQQPQYPAQQPQQPYYPPQQPQPEYFPQQPQYPAPSNPWLGGGTRKEADPWHQRPAASEIELQQEEDKRNKQQQQQLLQQLEQQGLDIGTLILQQDSEQKPPLINPWGQIQAIPAQLTKVPCKNGDVHRLTDSCSSVVVCRDSRPQLVQCPSAQTYDRPSDSCKVFTLAKC